MQKFIYLLLSLSLNFSFLYAQTPDVMCNNAGTIQFGAFVGQSNDPTPDTIFLCGQDSFFIQHNNDANFGGDPNPNTAPGIVYGRYTQRPTLSGPDLATIRTDNLVFDTHLGILKLVSGTAQGNTWIANSGSLTQFPNQEGLQYWYAPMTIDDFSALRYENNGACVHVNTAMAFSVVYLAPITVSGFAPGQTGEKCIEKMKLTGGLPAFDNTKSYELKLYKTNSPDINGVFLSSAFKHNTIIDFSVNEPGMYTLEVEDGKSCNTNFQIDMTGCDNTGRPYYEIKDTTVAPGEIFCAPVKVRNFNANEIIILSFSLNWDPTILEYMNTTSLLPNFNSTSDLHVLYAKEGRLGFAYMEPIAQSIDLKEGDAILEPCFRVIGQDDERTKICFSGNPTKATTYNAQGNEVVPIYTCGNFEANENDSIPSAIGFLDHEGFQIQLSPNPAQDFVLVNLPTFSASENGVIELFSTDGRLVLQKPIRGIETELQTSQLITGTYLVRVKLEQGTWSRQLLVH
jgi:Secretion system C-terminal sorting domain/Cohesin domain